MITNRRLKDLISALSIATILYGSFLFFSKQYVIGSLMIVFGSFCTYFFYIRDRRIRQGGSYTNRINYLNVLLGFMLIFIDLAFNLATGDNIGHFDLSLILCGTGIVVLNLNLLDFLKLDPTLINFVSRFLFIFVLMYGFVHTGIVYLTGSSSENYLLTYMTLLSGRVSCLFLNFLGPTTIHSIFDPWSEGILINFKGFEVGIFSPCSGVESITVFLSAAIAYTLSEKNIRVKRMIVYSLIGLIALFFINILRIILLVLIGYSFGAEPMRFFHYNLGWVFFVIGMAVFWALVMRE